MAHFSASIGFDWRLYEADITGSIAWAKGLERAGILTPAERDQIIAGLEQIRAEFASGQFEPRPTDEDIHTAVERRLHELIGPVAGKLHTGRSRNDQVATDLRLYTRAAVDRIQGLIAQVQTAIVDQAEAHIEVIMPGYTHLRRAQPILFSHWLMSYFWMLQRDRERLAQLRRRVNVLPLGAGAVAGHSLGVDRQFLAQELGFDTVSENSVEAVSDRDFVAEFLFDAALLGAHLSRLAEDLILYSTAEFGFVEIDQAYATGSSIMPQKVNPDSLELVRGKTGRLIGHVVTMLTVLKGLPSSYNRDLQEDKEPLFDAVDVLEMALPVVAGVVRTLQVHPEHMVTAVDDGMLATDLADYLVRRGVPFRESHAIVGRLVRQADELGVPLSRLPLEAWQAAHSCFDEYTYTLFEVGRAVEARTAIGGTATRAVREQIARAREVLADPEGFRNLQGLR
jgi:argininosuccinate lyase